MKKYIIFALIALPTLVIGAVQLTPTRAFYDFNAQIENNSRGNVYLYETKLSNSTTTCVVAVQNYGQSASNIAIDCK